MIVWPVGIELQDWADQVAVDFGGAVPRLDNPDDWRDWADRLLESPDFSAGPRADGFEIWSDWAAALVRAIG